MTTKHPYLSQDFKSSAAVRTRRLEAVQFGVGHTLSAVGLSHIQTDVEEAQTFSRIGRDLGYQLRAYIYGETLGEKIIDVDFTYSVPGSWWDAFKAEHPRLCRWLSQPRYRRVTCTECRKVVAKALYPEFKPMPNHGRVVYMLDSRP